MADVIESPPPEEGSGGILQGLRGLLLNRYVQIGAGVLVAVIILLVVLGFVLRGSKSKNSTDHQKQAEKHYKYMPVFTELTPMDAAQMRQALSYENIPFESEKEGRIVNISIPKEFIDDARIKMAQLGLPEGGVVGFEIFDKAQSFGATEYDKQVQFIRAAGGELSRLISHMKGINSAKVQLVIPAQRAFGERVAGSASVMLHLKPKQNISDRQIKGIMHLVASSVEDIKPEDVTVVDTAGNILSERVKLSLIDKRQAMMFEMLTTHDDDKRSPLEMLLRFRDQLRANYENDFSQKTKQVLATLYPMGSYLVFLHVDLKESESESTPYVLNKIDVAILLDANNHDIKLTNQLKNSTFSLVASAIGYEISRDTIVIEKGPFVSIDSEQVGKLFSKTIGSAATSGKSQFSFIFKFIYAFVLITLLFIFLILRFMKAGKDDASKDNNAVPFPIEDELAKEKFQLYVQNNEEKVIQKLVAWLGES